MSGKNVSLATFLIPDLECEAGTRSILDGSVTAQPILQNLAPKHWHRPSPTIWPVSLHWPRSSPTIWPISLYWPKPSPTIRPISFHWPRPSPKWPISILWPRPSPTIWPISLYWPRPSPTIWQISLHLLHQIPDGWTLNDPYQDVPPGMQIFKSSSAPVQEGLRADQPSQTSPHHTLTTTP